MEAAASVPAERFDHLPDTQVPLALADLHGALAPGSQVELRFAATWPPDRLRDVVVGAGFRVDRVDAPGAHGSLVVVTATRAVNLPDTVADGMRLLVCGLNPSPAAADAGVGFFRAGNRFWPAALEAGLLTRDRDPLHALAVHGVGMTDLVKRTTVRADELSRDEYVAGLDRLERLCAWLGPGAVLMVGMAGWRTAVDRRAQAGWQDGTVGGRPIYLMPSTSGLNAATPLGALVDHLRRAAGRR